MKEIRVFEGKLERENELHSQDAYLVVGSDKPLCWSQQWVAGLYGKRVRITVEVLESEP